MIQIQEEEEGHKSKDKKKNLLQKNLKYTIIIHQNKSHYQNVHPKNKKHQTTPHHIMMMTTTTRTTTTSTSTSTSTKKIRLTPRQSTLIHGWLNPVPTLSWEDVVVRSRRKMRRLSFEFLLTTTKLRPADLVALQPDPQQWVQHAGAGLAHARQMMMWPANPFTHLGADLADVLSMRLTAVEMVSMGVTHGQLVANGMNEQTERLFRFDEEEWSMLGKLPLVKKTVG